MTKVLLNHELLSHRSEYLCPVHGLLSLREYHLSHGAAEWTVGCCHHRPVRVLVDVYVTPAILSAIRRAEEEGAL